MINKNQWPMLRYYDQEHSFRIAMPLGGIGTGTISLGGRGNLQDWEIVNRPAKGFTPRHAFFCLYVKEPDSPLTVTRILEGPIHPSQYEGAHGCAIPNHGLPHFQKSSFSSAYPLAQINLTDPSVPVDILLQAFNPLIPGNPDDSGYPAAILRYCATNKTDQTLQIAICGNLQNFIGADGSEPPLLDSYTPQSPYQKKNKIEFRIAQQAQGLYYSTDGLASTDEKWGTIALATTETAGISYRTAWANYLWGNSLLDFWDDFSEDGCVDERAQDGVDAPTGSLSVKLELPPFETRTVTFLLAWHFPNRMTWTKIPEESGKNDCCCDDKDSCKNPNWVGNYYCTQYKDAWDVVVSLASRLDDLERWTIQFVSSFLDSNIPDIVKEAALFNLSTLRSQTCFRTADGRFFGWEGCNDHSGCCHGSCTHVWNYEHATPFLFGSLAWLMREVEFAHATDERGKMSFRVNLPLSHAKDWETAAADGQMGCIMRLYREWQLSGDNEKLKALWPYARKALEFCWIPGGWDADQDGVMEGCQHNTMDVEYYGPNPQMQGWYLGALRAAEEMSRSVGETEFADRCHHLFESGRKWTDSNLFNGEYYEHQIIPPLKPENIAQGLRDNTAGARNWADPEFQLGAGCLIDQLVGQYMAHICGLGYLLDPSHISTTMKSLMKYNFKEDFSSHFNHQRSFVLNRESGMLMATYPKGRRPAQPFPYCNEVMTGFEYTAAVGMFYEGQIENGLKLIQSIRDRYDGFKRNPFDEAECGHHYVRAMASWATIPALSGFHYSAVNGVLTLAPAWKPENHRAFWAVPSGWGNISYVLSRDRLSLLIEVKQGNLKVKQLYLPQVKYSGSKRVDVYLGGQVFSSSLRTERKGTVILVAGELMINPEQGLNLELDLI